MNNQEALQMKIAATNCFADLEAARRKLTGVPLTNELFNEVNGVERGLEHLLGRDVILPTDTNEIVALRNEIFAAIEAEQIKCGEAARAALECLGEDLLETIQQYDARATQDTDIRAKIKNAVADLSKDAANAFKAAKCDFSCFSNADVLEIIEMMKDTTKFLKSDTVNKSRIQDLMAKQGQEMTEEDNQFLDDLKKIFNSTVASDQNYDKLWSIRNNALVGAKVEALGFDPKTFVSTSEAFAKAEVQFIAAVRVLKEILDDRPLTTDSVVIKNDKFDSSLWGLTGWCSSMGRIRVKINEQFSLMLGLLETTSVQPDDNSQQQNTEPNPKPSNKEEGGEPNPPNDDGSAGSEPEA